MRNIKKIFFIIVAVVISMYAFSACVDKDNNVSGTMTVVIAEESPVVFTVNLSEVEINEGVVSILEYLNKTKDLQYSLERSLYGAYLTQVGGLQQADGSYIYLYTSVAKDMDTSMYATQIEYNGQKLMSSGLGISEMTIEKDCIIYISLMTM